MALQATSRNHVNYVMYYITKNAGIFPLADKPGKIIFLSPDLLSDSASNRVCGLVPEVPDGAARGVFSALRRLFAIIFMMPYNKGLDSLSY